MKSGHITENNHLPSSIFRVASFISPKQKRKCPLYPTNKIPFLRNPREEIVLHRLTWRLSFWYQVRKWANSCLIKINFSVKYKENSFGKGSFGWNCVGRNFISVARVWNIDKAFFLPLPKVMSCVLIKDENSKMPPAPHTHTHRKWE